ncbi:acyl carrier protein [Microbispora sp. NPDC049125]|uniref:acyl carrier protein n=1 Tax=Microbispora sp. NPDC049125 TaxID=3154929 RepID=UPI003465C17C
MNRVLVHHIAGVKPSLDAGTIQAADSLTVDLGFDSLDLVELSQRIRRVEPGVDLRPWFAGASMSDTVASLAAHLGWAIEEPVRTLSPAGSDHG